MDTSTNHDSSIRKTLLSLLTFGLWLLTVALGFWVVALIQETVDAKLTTYIVQEIENKDMGIWKGGGLRSIVNYATIGVGVLVWIGAVVIAGMDYHFKRVGERNSYRLFAWTIGIEIVILLICRMVLAMEP